jgi:hypothetical protein
MQTSNHDYFAVLIEEQRIKQLAMDEQVQLELSGLTEPEINKKMRRCYMEYLANRILQIETLLDAWLNSVELPDAVSE